MTVEQVRSTLRERIARGATLDELETLLRMTRGLTERERGALLTEAWHYNPRRMPLRRMSRLPLQRMNAARRWFGRVSPNGVRIARRGRPSRTRTH